MLPPTKLGFISAEFIRTRTGAPANPSAPAAARGNPGASMTNARFGGIYAS
jgi:hypothetical protein